MQKDVAPAEDGDQFRQNPKWRLVQRVLASSAFAKSDRLCQFLTFICELSLQGCENEINEVNIGARLFGRPNYDPAVDGIVRSHASRLRQRLEQHFSTEGAHEPLRIVIPKGSYVPVFEPRPVSLGAPIEPAPVLPKPIGLTPDQRPGHSSRRIIWALGITLCLSCIAIAWLTFLLRGRVNHDSQTIDSHPLWNFFFGTGHQSVVVCSDTSLTELEDMTGHDVNVPDYVNGSYRNSIGATPDVSAGVLQNLTTRRYTAIADVGILTRFYHLAGVQPDRIQLRYARDVRPDELKQGSIILIGSGYSDPWVNLFEPQMNFLFRMDPSKHEMSVVNRSPRRDELSQYQTTSADGSHRVYGVVALRPNLTGSGKVLILEGTSMAGTEASADFVFDDQILRPYLAKITARNGKLPYFEVLLESTNINGSASRVHIVSYRTSED